MKSLSGQVIASIHTFKQDLLLQRPGVLVAALVGSAMVILGIVMAPAPEASAATLKSSSSSPAEQSAQPGAKQLNGDHVTFKTESSMADLLEPASTSATASIVLDQPCTRFAGVTLLPSLDMPGLVPAAELAGSIEETRQDAASCYGTIKTSIAKDAPADGLLQIASTAPGLTGTTILKFGVERSSAFALYWLAFKLALLVGLLAGLTILCLLALRRRRVPERAFPKDYEYGKLWASGATAVAALGSALLAGNGVLASFSAQYKPNGIVVANIVVAAIIAAAPIVVVWLYRASERAGFRQLLLSTAGALTVTGVTAQVLLDGLYLLSTGANVQITRPIIVVGSLLAVLLILFVVTDIVRLPQVPASEPVYTVQLKSAAGQPGRWAAVQKQSWWAALVLFLVLLLRSTAERRQG